MDHSSNQTKVKCNKYVTMLKHSCQGWGVAHIIEHLPSKHQVLSSNPSMGKQTNKKTSKLLSRVVTQFWSLFTGVPPYP
jgi:hypothetical protein